MTSGKRRGLEAVADSRGVIAALAIDQRGSLRSLFAKAMGVEPASVPVEMLVAFKEAVSRVLTPHASAILLDPEYGLPAAKQRAKSAGLLLAYVSRPATTSQCGDACRDCWRDGRSSAWWKLGRTA